MDLKPITGRDEAVTADLAKAYAACYGTPLYETPCVLCRLPLRSLPFQLHVLVILDQCPQGGGHLNAAAVARHLDCQPLYDDELVEAIAATINHTHAG